MSQERTEAEEFRETVCARFGTRMSLVPSDKSLGALRFPAGRSEGSSCSPWRGRIAVCEARFLVLDAGKTFREVLGAELTGECGQPSSGDGLDRRGTGLPLGGVGPSGEGRGQWSPARGEVLGPWALLVPLALWGGEKASRVALGARGPRGEQECARAELRLHFASSPQAGQANSLRWSGTRKQKNVQGMETER